MAVFNAVKLFSSPWMIVRHKSKPRIQDTRLPFWIRLQTLETVKPIFPPDTRPPMEQCELANIPPPRESTTFEKLLGKELLGYLDSSPLVGIYHANAIKGRPRMFVIKHLLRNNMRLGIYSRDVVRRALVGTKYEAILPLFSSYTQFVFSKEPSVKVLLKLQKNMPQYILLAGIVENCIMSKKELEWYGSLPSLEVMHGQLYMTLNSFSAQLLQHLNHHQMHLSHSLSLLAKPEEQEPLSTE